MKRTYSIVGGPLDGMRETPTGYVLRKGDRVWFLHIPKLGQHQHVGYNFDGKQLTFAETREL